MPVLDPYIIDKQGMLSGYHSLILESLAVQAKEKHMGRRWQAASLE